MKCTVIIDDTKDEEVIICAHKRNETVEKIEAFVNNDTKTFNGYLHGEIVKLNVNDIYCFTIIDGKLYAITESKNYLIKLRLYSVDQLLDNNFIKINQSSIANITKIQKFDVSIGGTLKVIFKNGYIDYVSRRSIKTVKERLGL